MKCELYQFYPEVYPFNLWIYVGKDVSGMVEFLKQFAMKHPMFLLKLLIS